MNNIVLFNLGFPVAIQLVLLLLKDSVLFFALADLIIQPLVMLFFNIYAASKSGIPFLKCGLFMLVGILLGDILGYVIWGISSKRLFHPDGETVYLYQKLIACHIGTVLIVLVLFSLLKNFFFKK